ncbi:hypothetical protein GGR28_000812 [Lewinella aquimaris]|uniref:Uncharacterized protein n=1 Tax=Neolewinella aquimaris TaxID=1835722 RepID=A0A840DYZ8_9BACT|nr:hypothetical protein [Neolewinella aquimaris]MBB4078211.1 hypothetical protein [Neolewinella aquimaris]
MRYLFCWLLIGSLYAGAQPSLFDELWECNDTVTIALETNTKRLLRNKKEKSYQPATVHINGRTLSGRVRSRGHIRLEVCRFPSLKIKLDKTALDSLGFTELNDLKLVVQCSSHSAAEGYLRREKLIYDLHAMVSRYHHRTIPVHLYLGDRILEAFLVEAEEQLAARYGAIVVESDQVSTRGLQREAYLNMCLFNYMVLNTDWNVFNLHNVECLQLTESRELIPIPYDFDYSGVVGTTYAVPHDAHNLRSVQQPKWLGRHVTEEELSAALLPFLDARARMVDHVNSCHDLHPGHQKRILDRLTEFYELIENPAALRAFTSN